MSSESIGFRLRLTCDNAAFDDGMATEISRCLQDVARRIEQGEDCSRYRNILDLNGNIVGQFKLAPVSEL